MGYALRTSEWQPDPYQANSNSEKNMKIQTTIQDKLNRHFKPEYLEVINESASHNVPAGSESHFKVILVTADFASQMLIKRHRAINAVLKDELANDIHALALHTYTPAEWQQHNVEAPKSPNCLGGAK
jgi:BolA protein